MFKVTCCVTEACEYRTSVQRRVLDASKGAETQFNKCIYYSLAAEESADITPTTQMWLFGVMSNFEEFEELVDFHSVHGQAKGLGSFNDCVVFRTVIGNYINLQACRVRLALIWHGVFSLWAYVRVRSPEQNSYGIVAVCSNKTWLTKLWSENNTEPVKVAVTFYTCIREVRMWYWPLSGSGTKVNEILAVNKQTTQRLHIERFNFKKLNEVGDKEQ
jgi:hypothetical protein